MERVYKEDEQIEVGVVFIHEHDGKRYMAVKAADPSACAGCAFFNGYDDEDEETCALCARSPQCLTESGIVFEEVTQ